MQFKSALLAFMAMPFLGALAEDAKVGLKFHGSSSRCQSLLALLFLLRGRH